MNKKGFVIAPVIFIVFMIIAIVFSFYVSNIDREISEGIHKSSSIQMGIYEIEKELINQETFVRIAIQVCKDDENYIDIDCVENELDNYLEGHDWNLDIYENMFEFNSKSINATNINMALDSIKIEGNFSD